MIIGDKYRFKYQLGAPVELVYIGRKTYPSRRFWYCFCFWYCFAKAENPNEVWCELQESDFDLIEKISADEEVKVS